MANGTQYNTKQELLDAIQALVFENDDNLTESDNIQKASKDIVESLWNGANPSATSHTAYVSDEFGNDSTGVVGVESKKFKTINAANASTATTIKIEIGYYPEDKVLKGSKTYECARGVVIQPPTNMNEDNFSGKVYGYGTFALGVSGFNLFKNLNSCYIEFNAIIADINKPLLTANNNAYIRLVGKADPNIRAGCNLGYEGIYGYPSTGSGVRIDSRNIDFAVGANNAALCPFNLPGLDFRFYDCSLRALTNGVIFGRYSAAATGIKMVLNNCYLIATAAVASEDGIGAYQYTYIDNNTYSNKALHANTLPFQGALIVDLDIANLF